jgi:hypothetical protein
MKSKSNDRAVRSSEDLAAAIDFTVPNQVLSMADVMIMSPLVAFILSFASSHRLISDERRVAACVIAGLPVVCLIGVYVAWVRA